MIVRRPATSSIPSRLLPCIQCTAFFRRLPPRIITTKSTQTRTLHAPKTKTSTLTIPSPTPFVPNVQTFLTLIGRQLSQHSAKIPTWDALFTLSSTQLRELGVEPARARRYLLWWRERYRKGERGIGGDLDFVDGGSGEVRILEMEGGRGAMTAAFTTKIVVNVPSGTELKPGINLEEVFGTDQVKPVSGVKVRGAHTIVGPHVESLKGGGGSIATIKVKEGMWEQKRGHKVDGGERRKENVRSRRAAQERGTLRK